MDTIWDFLTVCMFYGQTVLPDRLFLNGQKLVENAKIRKLIETFWVDKLSIKMPKMVHFGILVFFPFFFFLYENLVFLYDFSILLFLVDLRAGSSVQELRGHQSSILSVNFEFSRQKSWFYSKFGNCWILILAPKFKILLKIHL